MRFKDYELTVVNVEPSSYDYTLTINKNFVTFSKGIIKELGYPSHVIIALNKEKQVMGIQACRAKTRGAFKFSKPEGSQKGIVQIGNRTVKEALLHIMKDWKADKRYRVEGIHIPEDKAFVFELNTYSELSDFRKGDAGVKD